MKINSCRVMQRIFTEYKQPFALTYLGISLMVMYLPLAFFKDWICSLMDKNLLGNLYIDNPCLSSSIGLNIPLRANDTHHISESNIKTCLITDGDFNQVEQGQTLAYKSRENESCVLTEKSERSSWETAKYSLYLAPIWFATEVTVLVLAGF